MAQGGSLISIEDDGRPTAPVTNPPSRRIDVRLAAPSDLRTSVTGSRVHVVVQDISVGGMGVVSSLPLARGVVQKFQLALGTTVIVQQGKPVHCRRQDDGRWSVGISFTGKQFAGPGVEDLIDAITRSQLRFS